MGHHRIEICAFSRPVCYWLELTAIKKLPSNKTLNFLTYNTVHIG